MFWAAGPLMLQACIVALMTVVAVGVSQPASVLTLERAFPLNQRVDIGVLRERDSLHHARVLRGFGGVVDFDVQGTADEFLFGLYFTRVKLGTPPTVFNVQIDTGSNVLWVACRNCSYCPQTSALGIDLNFFDTSGSSTAALVTCSDPVCTSSGQISASQCSSQTDQCGYTFQYRDGSGTSGFYVSDMLYFDMLLGDSLVANSSESIVFGCSTYQSGDLTKSDKAVDGIFGFGPNTLSVISQLSARGITPKVFSHCLKGEGSGGGILVLGEILDPSIVYSPLVPSQFHYNLKLQSLAVNGKLVSIDPAVFPTANNQEVIIDSGTTLAYLVEEVYDPFVSAVTSVVSKSAIPVINNGNQCYLVTSSINDTFPTASLNFEADASMVLKPEQYLVRTGFQDGASLWCMGFQKVQGVSLLGDLVLKDKIIIYDLAHQRIGWANYNCSSSVNVSITFSRDEYINAGQINVSSCPSVFFTALAAAQMLLGFLLLGSVT